MREAKMHNMTISLTDPFTLQLADGHKINVSIYQLRPEDVMVIDDAEAGKPATRIEQEDSIIFKTANNPIEEGHSVDGYLLGAIPDTDIRSINLVGAEYVIYFKDNQERLYRTHYTLTDVIK